MPGPFSFVAHLCLSCCSEHAGARFGGETSPVDTETRDARAGCRSLFGFIRYPFGRFLARLVFVLCSFLNNLCLFHRLGVVIEVLRQLYLCPIIEIS